MNKVLDKSVAEAIKNEQEDDRGGEEERMTQHEVAHKETDISKVYGKEYGIEDYEPHDNELDIAKTVEKTHPQMAPLVILEQSVALAWKMGFLVAQPKGMGKSCSLEALEDSPLEFDNKMWADSLTPSGARKSVGESDKAPSFAEELSHSKSHIFIDDLSSLMGREAGGNTFRFLSQLIYKETWEDHSLMDVKVENAEMVVFVAGTPLTVNELVRRDVWQSHVKDRFLRAHWLYFERPNLFEQSFGGRDYPKIPKVDMELGDVKWTVDKKWKNRVRDLIQEQTSYTRANLFTEKALTGHAKLCNRKAVTNADAKWFLHYRPVIEPENIFTIRPRSGEGSLSASSLRFMNLFPEVLAYISLGYGRMKQLTDKENCKNGLQKLLDETNLERGLLIDILDKLKNGAGIIDVGIDETVKGKRVLDDIKVCGEFRRDLQRLHNLYE